MFELEDDPSDWPPQFSEMKKIDSLLRCSICFEYFNIAVVVPTCSHNYCSRCIRKHLTLKKFCPTCNKPLVDSDLNCNRVLDELVDHFKSVRVRLLKVINSYLSRGFTNDNVEERIEEDEPDSQASVFAASQKYRNPKSKPNVKLKTKQKGSKSNGWETTTNVSEMEQAEIEPGFACCPVCQEQVPEGNINIHLDSCLKNETRPKRGRGSSPSTGQHNSKKRKKDERGVAEENFADQHSEMVFRRAASECLSQSSSQKETANDLIIPSSSRVIKPLPKMCFDLMNEKKLKAQTKLYGLQSKGDRRALIKRLESYVLLHNAQCDSHRPLSPRSIAKKIEHDERELSKHGYKPNHVIHTHDRTHTDQEKEQSLQLYAQRFENHFTELIEQVESRKDRKLPVKTELFESTGDAQEYVFNIVEVNSDSDDDVDTNDETLCKSTEDKFTDRIITTPIKETRTRHEANVNSKNQQLSNSQTTSTGSNTPKRTKSNISVSKKSNIKKNSVQSHVITSFFKSENTSGITSTSTAKNQQLTLAKKPANINSPLVTVKDKRPVPVTPHRRVPERVSNIPKSPTIYREKTHGVSSPFNSTVVERCANKPTCEMSANLSPVFDEDGDSPRRRYKISNTKKENMSQRLKKKGSFSLESRGTFGKSRVLEYDTDDEMEKSNESCSPSLFQKCTKADMTENFSGLTNEISFLVDQAIINPHVISSDSDTEVEDDDLIPRPPSNLDFTGIDSQKY